MTYFELLEQFWQLDAERTIAPAASKLYFYLLNEFNSARPTHWPALLHRRATQVYADLRVDKKTLPPAIAILEARGLIRHYAGDTTRSGEWHLNYGPAAEWSAGKGKNSPQSTPEYGEKFPTETPKRSEGVGNFSPPIRNRQDEEVDKTPPPGARACVGEAAEKIAHAPLPTEASELVPPVAEPPHAAELRPVAAAELPAALAAEAKALANELAPIWDFTEMSNQPRWAKLHRFARRMATLGRLPEVRQQVAGYRAGHLRPGVRPHQLDKWLGSPDDDYQGGEWCSCNWAGVAAKVQARPGQSAPPPTRASASPASQQVAGRERHR